MPLFTIGEQLWTKVHFWKNITSATLHQRNKGRFMKFKILYMIIVTGSLLNISANNIIASKTGSLTKYSKCMIKDGKGIIEISDFQTNTISESTTLYNTFYNIKKLAPGAISNIEPQRYVWSVTQTDYFVSNEFDQLVNFYSYGFTNIANNSYESDIIVEQIDKVCSSLNDFKIIGKFQLSLKIGEKVFIDELIIERKTHYNEAPYLTGTYSVPNSFIADIKDLTYNNNQFSFTIRVQEGDADYEAFFEGTFSDRNIFKGNSFVLPQNSLLGVFEGKRI
jgi:hypothetical protein